MNQCLMSLIDVQHIMNEVFENRYQIKEIEKIMGGAQKGTYKVMCDERFSCVLYIWDKSLSYFESVHTEEEFTSNSGYLFKENYELMKQYGVHVPEIYYIDLSKEKWSFEYALVQYIDGGELEEILYDKQVDVAALLDDLRGNMNRLHSVTSNRVGDLRYMREEDFSCEAYIKKSLDEALEYLFVNYEPITHLKSQLVALSTQLYEQIEKRQEYALIHYELGPNHVMIDKEGKTYLIDFEGMKYFDLEYEYSFVQLRYGDYYSQIISCDVDENRMRYYLFYHHIAAIEGAHQLLVQDYYDLEDIQSMINYNYEAVIKNYL